MTLARGLPIKVEMLFQDDVNEDWFGVGRVDLVGRCDVVSLNRESGGDVTSLNPESGGGDVSNVMLIMASGTLRRCQPIMMSGTSRRCQEIGSLCWLDARANAPLFL